MDNELSALTIIFTEFYYWLTVVIMFFIHVGFCMYEVGVSRHKNHMHTLMKNTMLIPLVTITFFFFGWWIYFAFPNGPGITGGLEAAPWAEPWSELMGPHMGGAPASAELTAEDTAGWARINGVFWAAFLLFSWTAASIVSGSVIERIKSTGFWILAVGIGSVWWIIDAAWGWHSAGWMVQKLGYHDAYASGVIHAIAGGYALGILMVLGPRIGKFAADGTPRNIHPRNPWLVTLGLFLIYTGFWGFYVACNVPIWDIQSGDGTFFSATNIYLAPTTLSAITVNFLMRTVDGLHRLQGRRLLDVLLGSCRDHRRFGGQRSLPSDPGDDHRRSGRGVHVQGSLLRRAPLQDRRCGGRRGRAWLRGLLRRGGRRLRAVGLPVLARHLVRLHQPHRSIHRRDHHVRPPWPVARLGHGQGSRLFGHAAYSAPG
jgi:hypothetical protein